MSHSIGQPGGRSRGSRAPALVLVLHGSCFPWFFFHAPFPTTAPPYPDEPSSVFPTTVVTSPALAYLVAPWSAHPLRVPNLGCRAEARVFHRSPPLHTVRPRPPKETAGSDWLRRCRAVHDPARRAARAGRQWSARRG